MNLKNHESISELVNLASVRATYAYEQYDKLMGELGDARADGDEAPV